MKAFYLFITCLFVFSCRTEREVPFPNKSNFRFGTTQLPTIYWGVIEDKSLSKYMQRRSVCIYFFGENQVLYTLMSQECLGGNAFLSEVEIDKDKLLISSKHISESRNWDDYQQNFIINEWKTKNDSDSTLVGRSGLKLKKILTDLPPDEDGITAYQYMHYRLKAYLSKAKKQ